MSSALRKAGAKCLLIACLGTPCLGTLLWAQQPSLQPSQPPPGLHPLAFATTGRVLTEDLSASEGAGAKGYEVQWPGVYFDTAFGGRELYLRVGTSHAIFHVVVDGGEPLVLKSPEPGLYRLSGLRAGRHAVRVLVVTEDQQLPTIFGGFGLVAGEKALPIEPSRRQIEFIGDSHTVGYGNTSTKRECTTDEVWATTDSSAAFGALTAAHYHAAYEVNAISGRGVVRNYNNSPGDTLPAAYPYVLFDKKQPVADPAWKPQVLVIALGTNDFSTPLHDGEKWKTREQLRADYEATYLRFLQGLRAKNPGALLIVWATDMASGEIESEAGKVVQAMKAGGESRIAFVPMDHLQFSGCHSHPSLVDDRTIRDRLVQAIDATPGVWQGN